MKTLLSAVVIAVAGGSPTLAIEPAVDASRSTTATELGTIVVAAPRMVQQRDKARRFWVAEHRALVSYRDLDLNRASDRELLRERIEIAAEELCAERATLYPDAIPGEAACVERTRDHGREQLEQAIEEARLAQSDVD